MRFLFGCVPCAKYLSYLVKPDTVGCTQTIERGPGLEMWSNSVMVSPCRPASAAAGRLSRITNSALLAVLAAGATAAAEDWPQWRGADRLGIWTETGILREFPDAGLIVKWRGPVGGGFAGPAVTGGRVFVLDYTETGPRTMDGRERILALDEEGGEVLWTCEWPTTYRMLMFS